MPFIDRQYTTNTRRNTIVFFGVVLAIVGLLSQLIQNGFSASPNAILAYQGRILDNAGNPIADATADITFAFYDDAAAGTCLWSNDSSTCNGGAGAVTEQTVTLTDGLFSENLGDTGDGYAAIASTVFTQNANVWLEVAINGETLVPRKKIVAQAYALNAGALDGFTSSQSGGTSAFVPVATSNGNLVLTGDPQGAGVNQGSVYINPAAPAANETLFGVANNGTSAFRVDAEGDTTIAGSVSVSDLTCTDCLDFAELSDALTLDAATDIATAGFTLSTSGIGALNFGSTGQVTFGGNVDATNGLDVTTANLTVGGANFAVTVGTGSITTAGDLAVNGDDITSDGTLTIDSSGTVQLGTDDDFLPQLGAGSADVGATGTRWDNLFAVAGDFSGTVTGADFACTDCLDFAELSDALTLDAATSIATAGFTLSTSGIGALNFGSTGQVTFGGNVDATNGLDVTTANLTVGGANFAVTVGTGSITTAGDLAVNGDDITSDGTLTIDSSGTVQLGADDDFLPQLGAGSADIGATGTRWDNLFAAAGDFSGTVTAADFACTDCLDFTELSDTLALDAALTLNQSTNTWTQNFTGAGTTGLTYNANSLTTGTGLALSTTSTALSSGSLLTATQNATLTGLPDTNISGSVGGFNRTVVVDTGTNLEIETGVVNITDNVSTIGAGAVDISGWGLGVTQAGLGDAIFARNTSATNTDNVLLITHAGNGSLISGTASFATTANTVDIAAPSLTTGQALKITTGNFTDDSGRALFIDTGETAAAADLILLQDDFGGANNDIFRVEGDGEVFSDIGFSAGASGTTNFLDNSIVSTGTFTLDSSGTVQLGTDDDFLPQLGAGSADIGATGTRWDNLFSVVGDYSDSVNIAAADAPTVDMLSITNTGQATTTANVDGLSLTFGATNSTNNLLHLVPSYTGNGSDTYSVLAVDAFTATTSGTDFVNGISIGALTDAGGGTINSTGISLGTGWDIGISGNGFYFDGNGALNITPSTNATALTLTGTNVTSNTLLSLAARTTSGTLLNTAFGGATTQTGGLTGLNLDMSTNLTGANNQFIKGAVVTTLGGTRSGGGTEGLTAYSALSGAAITQNTAAGAITWNGYLATIPAITQTTGSVQANGVNIAFPDTGAITTGGQETGINITAPTTGPAAGTMIGLNIGTITTPGAGTEQGIVIGNGWDTAITVNSGKFAVASTGITSVNLNGTATTNGLCHSGANVDAATDATRDIVACSGAPADFAEWYETDGSVAAGDVVALSDQTITYTANESNAFTGEILRATSQKTLPILTLASSASGSKTFGIISTSPIQVIGSDLKEQAEHPQPVALNGRVPLHVNDENGPIAPGDALTPSSTPGFARKANSGEAIVATALSSLTSGQGTIQVFVRYGAGQIVNDSASVNTASDTHSGSLSSLSLDGDLYLNGHQIINIGRLVGIADNWSVEEDGTFITTKTYTAEVDTLQGGTATVTATMSPQTTITLSGTSELNNGEAQIDFEDIDPNFNDIISPVAEIRVLVTANGPTDPLYVSEKDNNGFSVQESGGSSDVSFDWLVIAYRNGYEPSEALVPTTTPEVTPSETSTEEPALSETSADTAPPSDTPTTEPTTDTADTTTSTEPTESADPVSSSSDTPTDAAPTDSVPPAPDTSADTAPTP